MGVIKNIHRVVDVEEQKLCGHCGEFKNITGFYRINSSWDGLYSRCKECSRIINTEYQRKIHNRVPRGTFRPKYEHVTRPDGTIVKFCPKCMEMKPLEEFHILNRNWDGRYSVCKCCMSKQWKIRYRNRCLARYDKLDQTLSKSQET